MNMKFLIVIMAVVVCMESFLASAVDINSSFYWNRLQPFCGSRLTIEMAMICKGRYNLDPRSQPRKTKRGIVDECCTIPCTRKYLKDSYCAPEFTTAKPESRYVKTTTESIRTEFPVDYTSYYYALIARVKADREDYARHGYVV